MKAGLRRAWLGLAVLTVGAGAMGCASNDVSLSIQQMEAVVAPGCTVSTSGSTSVPGRDRGLLDLAQVGLEGYIGVPVIRNNLTSRSASGIELNSIQITGLNVSLQVSGSAASLLPAADQAYFYAAAGGRIDPGGTAAMFVEVLPARIAKELANAIPKGGLFTLIAELKPVGMQGGTQLIGGPIDFPVDLCAGCLVTNQQCPFPAGTTPAIGGCFRQQDDPLQCCTDTTGAVFCGATAPIAK